MRIRVEGNYATNPELLSVPGCASSKASDRQRWAAATKSSGHSEVGSCEVVPTEFTNDSLAICVACAAVFPVGFQDQNHRISEPFAVDT